MNVCSEGIIVYKINDAEVEVCGNPRDIIVIYNYPRLFGQLLDFFDKRYSGFANLVKLLLENDLRHYFLGTHDCMDRTLARLKKFKYIAERESAVLPFTDLFKLVFRDLNNIISTLEYFKKHIHRTRDKVHELVYPILRKTLRRFLFIDLYYMPYRRWSTRRYIHCWFRYDRLDNVVEKNCELVRETYNPYDPTETIPLTLGDVKRILEKQVKRIEKNHEHQRLWRQTWEYIECIEECDPKECYWKCWDPQDDTLFLLEQFLKVIDSGS